MVSITGRVLLIPDMKKRLTAFITLIVLCVMMIPMSALAEETEPITGECGDLIWEIGSSTLTISGSGDMNDFDSESASPWYEYKDSFNSLVINNISTVLKPRSIATLYGFLSLTQAKLTFSISASASIPELS